ncbi:MAG: ATP-binding cassette domain-containing protein, partial [Pseudomonadota bacterium]|nr:ATP-binding cassette domain-containing protein [Pseudomonadota bacterium]
MNALTVQGLVKRFGGLTATDHFDLELREGEIHAVIGPNGAGKTTLINQLSGELIPNEGTIRFGDIDVTFEPVHRRVQRGIARSYQITSVFLEFTALQNVMLAVQGASGRSLGFWRPVMHDAELVGPARLLLERVGLEVVADT